MAEEQLLRCREMAAELAHTEVGQAASIIIAVVNEVVADKRYQKPLVDFMVQNAHITLFRLLQVENKKQIFRLPKTQEQVGSYQFKKMPSGEVEIRDYVVFYSPNRDEYKFYNVFSEEPKITIFGQSAILLTESAAEDMADVLSQNSPKSWFYYKADYFLRKEKQQSENDKPNADKG